MISNPIIINACNLIKEDLQNVQKDDIYRRSFNYDPYSDLCKILHRSILERMAKKDPLQLLEDIHTLRWYEEDDVDWEILF